MLADIFFLFRRAANRIAFQQNGDGYAPVQGGNQVVGDGYVFKGKAFDGDAGFGGIQMQFEGFVGVVGGNGDGEGARLGKLGGLKVGV